MLTFASIAMLHTFVLYMGTTHLYCTWVPQATYYISAKNLLKCNQCWGRKERKKGVLTQRQVAFLSPPMQPAQWPGMHC